jgi:hypothetical protein
VTGAAPNNRLSSGIGFFFPRRRNKALRESSLFYDIRCVAEDVISPHPKQQLPTMSSDI